MKVALIFLFTGLFSVLSKAQGIHHQMISSQGASVHVSNSLLVQQTIGQQSSIGNYFGSTFSVGQGFQQGKITNSKGPSTLNIQITTFPNPSALNIQITTFPNPFSSKINFQFSTSIDGLIKISIYDAMGKLVMTSEKELLNSRMSLDNLNFPDGQYIVKLIAKNFNHTCKLIKMK